MYVGDDKGRRYDVEMQTTDQRNLSRRARYYQTAIDITNLSIREDYNVLPDSYVIFLCTFDFFGRGLPVYTFRNVCEEDYSLPLNDGTTKIFLNSRAAKDENVPGLKTFLEYMNGIVDPDDSFISALEKDVKKIKENDERKAGRQASVF